MRFAFIPVLALAVASIASAQQPVDHSAFDAILQKHVREGAIDYLSIRKADYGKLVAYLGRLAEVDHVALPYHERLAMYCNLYNATMIRVVVERFHANYSVAENGKHIFGEPLVHLKEGITTLNHLEHEMIRQGFPGEYRVHASLVCAGLGCPKIAPRALRADQLDAMLNDDMRRWVNDPTRNTIDAEKGVATLSKLFKFYAEDFGGLDKVVGVLDRYTDTDLSRLNVTYSDFYDWTLNVAQPSEGRWVKVTSDHALVTKLGIGGATLHVKRDEVFEVVAEGRGTLELARRGGETCSSVWIGTGDVAPYVAAEHKWQPEKKQ